jgi:hypothetical protein
VDGWITLVINWFHGHDWMVSSSDVMSNSDCVTSIEYFDDGTR